MHFCPQCNNLFHVRIADDDPNKLIYYCACCSITETQIDASKTLVATYVSQSQAKYRHIINEYTKYDPTLPIIQEKMLCPNSECPTNATGKEAEAQNILKICYDNTNKKYVYLCAVCDENWELN